MPIRPEEKARYPTNWKAISLRIRDGAGNRCECRGECGDDHDGRCDAPNLTLIVRHETEPRRRKTFEAVHDDLNAHGEQAVLDYISSPIKVVLTVAHLDHTPENCDDLNLLAMCQRCHLRYDREHHAETRRATRDERNGQQGLF